MPLDLFVPSMHVYAMLMLILVECVLKCVCVCVCMLVAHCVCVCPRVRLLASLEAHLKVTFDQGLFSHDAPPISFDPPAPAIKKTKKLTPHLHIFTT